MVIGIPKALLYYRYSRLWECFFRALGADVILSGDTTKAMAERGGLLSMDESCLPAKIFMGHAESLIDKCDAVFIPRYDNIGKNDEFCVRFRGLYDVTRSTLNNPPVITLDVNVKNHKRERPQFAILGMKLGFCPYRSLAAYNYAKSEQMKEDEQARSEQASRLKGDKPTVLLCGHDYITRDKYISGPIVKIISEQGGEILYSDGCASCNESLRGMYWTAGKANAGAAFYCEGRVDGMILLSAFPCGSDAMVNEMIMRGVSRVPVIQIVADELSGDAGLVTRVESFMDILHERRKKHENNFSASGRV